MAKRARSETIHLRSNFLKKKTLKMRKQNTDESCTSTDEISPKNVHDVDFRWIQLCNCLVWNTNSLLPCCSLLIETKAFNFESSEGWYCSSWWFIKKLFQLMYIQFLFFSLKLTQTFASQLQRIPNYNLTHSRIVKLAGAVSVFSFFFWTSIF